jgi:hypothetical protein
MDTVVFTGRISEHEMKEERLVQWERMEKDGTLAAYETTPPSIEAKWFGWTIGTLALVLGIITIVLIIASVL